MLRGFFDFHDYELLDLLEALQEICELLVNLFGHVGSQLCLRFVLLVDFCEVGIGRSDRRMLLVQRMSAFRTDKFGAALVETNRYHFVIFVEGT